MKRISLVALLTILWLSAQAHFVPYKSLGEPWMDSAVSEGIRKIGEAEFVRNYGMPNWVAGSDKAEFGSHYIVIDLAKWTPELSATRFYYERGNDPSFYSTTSSPWRTWDSINAYNGRYDLQSDYIALYNIVLKNFPFPLKKDISKVKTDEGRNLFTQLQQIDAINDSGYSAQLYAFRTIVENICTGATNLYGYNGQPIVCYGSANLLGQFGNKPDMRASFGAFYVYYHNFNNPPTWLADLARIPKNLCPPITSLTKPSIEEKNFEIATAVQHFIECNAYGRCIMDGSVFGNMYARWLYDNLKTSTVISPTLLLSTCMKLNGLAPEFSWSILTVGYETGHDEYNMTSLGPVYNSYTNASLEAISHYCDIMPRAQVAFKTDANIDRDSALYYGRMLYRIPSYMLEISTGQRVKLLDIITNSICWDMQGANDAADYRNHCEQICKSLYTYLPDGQEREFLGLLWEQHLLWDLSYRLDNTTVGFFGNDNYTDFIFTISSYWKEAYPERSQPTNGESVHYFVIKWESSFFNSNGRIVANESANSITVHQHQRVNYTWYTTYIGSYNLDVYDPVTIHVAEGSFIPDLPGVKDLTVPAIFLDWLYHKKTLDDAATTAHVTLAVAALATGIGEFYQATSISMRVVSALEVAISTSDLVLLNETVRNSVISSFENEADGRSFLQMYENITMMINFSVAAKGLISTFDYDCAQYVSKFDSRVAALRSTLGENSAEFRGFEKVRNSLSDIKAADQWIDDLGVILGEEARWQIRAWINYGLDANKTQLAFANATDKVALYNNLQNAKSIYHQRILIKDRASIPGISNTPYVNNGLPEQPIPASSFGETNPAYDLPSYRATAFTESAELITLPEGTMLYRVTDDGGQYGAWWTLTPPTDVGEVIGGTAVMPQWNGFSMVWRCEVPAGGFKVWKGKAASQPISDVAELQSPSHCLLGGSEQIFINDIVRNQPNFRPSVKDFTDEYKVW